MTRTETSRRTAVGAKRPAPPPEGEAFFPSGWLVGSYLLLSIIFFLPTLMPGIMIFGTDYLAISYYFEEFVTARFAAGELPKWMPYVYGGVPFFANPMDIYYPINVVLRLIGVPTSNHMELLFIAQYFLAGLGTFLLLREIGTRTMPAYLGGLLYMFAGYLIAYIYGGHEGRAIVATLTPLVFFALHRGIRTGALRWFLLAGAVMGASHLSNQIQANYYMLLAVPFWSLFALIQTGTFRPTRSLLPRIGGGVLSLLIGFALAAINYLPFLGYVEASPRAGEGGRGYEYATSWSMAPEEIVGLAVPERIGVLENYWGQNPMKLHTEYAGALTILLVVVGFVLLRRSRYAWFFGGLGLVTLTFAFGGHTPIYRIYYALLPGGYDKFRAPSISFFLFSLALVVLAALALDRLLELRQRLGARAASERKDAEATYRSVLYAAGGLGAFVLLWGLITMAGAPPPPTGPITTQEGLRAARAALNHPEYVKGVWRFALFLGLSAGALWLWLRRTLPTQAAAVVLALIAVADLWIVGKRYFETIPHAAVVAPDDVANFLRAQPGPFRTFVLFDMAQDNYYTQFGIELLGGEHGNQLQSYNEFLGAGERQYTDFHNILGNPGIFMPLANVRYLVTTQAEQIGGGMFEPVHQGRTRQGQVATIFENRMALPRAFLVPGATRAELPAGALARMNEPDFDPTVEVVLYDEPTILSRSGEPSGGAARVIRHEPSRVVVQASTPEAAYLVLLDNHYDGWRAEVDGRELPVLRAYHTFRAVPLPAGEHEVIFRFESPRLRAGLIVSATTALLLLAFFVALPFWDRRRWAAAGEARPS
jgi:hypothetical protein